MIFYIKVIYISIYLIYFYESKNQYFILIYTYSYSVRKVTSAQISPLAQISLSNVKSKME